MIDRERLGQKLKNRRKELGFTLKDAAERAGMSFQTLSDIEKGANTTVKRLNDLVLVLGLDVRVDVRPIGDLPESLDVSDVPADRRSLVLRLAETASALTGDQVDVLLHLLQIFRLQLPDEP